METKPGWKTSEFWLILAAGGGLNLLTELDKGIETMGLPPWALMLHKLAAPTISGALIAYYTKHRSALKATAAATVQTPSDADKALGVVAKMLLAIVIFGLLLPRPAYADVVLGQQPLDAPIQALIVQKGDTVPFAGRCFDEANYVALGKKMAGTEAVALPENPAQLGLPWWSAVGFGALGIAVGVVIASVAGSHSPPSK